MGFRFGFGRGLGYFGVGIWSLGLTVLMLLGGLGVYACGFDFGFKIWGFMRAWVFLGLRCVMGCGALGVGCFRVGLDFAHFGWVLV